MKHKPKHYAEYALLRVVAASVQYVPLTLALAQGWLWAFILHFVIGFRRKEARRRIREVFGEQFSPKEIRRIAWRSWRNLCFNIVEIVRVPAASSDYMEHVIINTNDVLKLKEVVAASGTGGVLVTCHFGNWEIAGLVGHYFKIPLFVIARRQKNKLVDEYLNRMRVHTGSEVVLSDDPGMLRQAVKKIKSGQVLAILPDVRSRTEALSVPFINGTANVAAGTALFARMARVPIYPALSFREGWSKHRCLFFDVIEPDMSLSKTEDYTRITTKLLALFSEQVMQHPDQYFWYNKRWVLDPL